MLAHHDHTLPDDKARDEQGDTEDRETHRLHTERQPSELARFPSQMDQHLHRQSLKPRRLRNDLKRFCFSHVPFSIVCPWSRIHATSVSKCSQPRNMTEPPEALNSV